MKYSKAFTLIELLVVISIISLLSSIVLSSLKSARAKANFGAIQSEMTQIRSILTVNYSDTVGYSGLFTKSTGGASNIWVNKASQCTTAYGSNSASGASQMLAACLRLMALINPSDVDGPSILIGNVASDQTKFSINVWDRTTPSLTLYCMGSNGVNWNSVDPDGAQGPLTFYDNQGCYYNP